MHGIGLNGIWISVDVCVRAVCVFLAYMCVHTCRCAVSAYLQLLYLITDMYVLLEFLDRGTLPLQSPFNTRRSMRTHTQAHHTSYRWHTHVTTATRYSWRRATDREGETTILADQSFSKSRVTGIAYCFFFFQIFFFLRAKKFHIHHLIKYLKVYIHTYIIFTTWDSHWLISSWMLTVKTIIVKVVWCKFHVSPRHIYEMMQSHYWHG